ncbi:hypothetical protein [Soonwooa purpurea]
MKSKLIFLSLIATNFVFAQNCDETKKENEYLKQVINVNKPEYKLDFDKTNFSITKIEGNIKQQTVTISILVNNQDVNKYVSMNDFTGIDLEGNEYKKKEYTETKGLNSLGSDTFSTDVPKKIEPILVKIPSNTQFLKLLKFDYYSDILKNHKTLEFRDLKINWK